MSGLMSSQIPVAELVPEELVERLGGVVEAVGFDGAVHILLDLFEAVEQPLVMEPLHLVEFHGGGHVLGQVHEREPGSVPQLC